MWTDMGDYLSRQYAGTDSTISSVSRDGKESIVQEKKVAMQRFFKNTAIDNPMQLSIDIILGKFDNQGFIQDQKKFVDLEIGKINELQPKIEQIIISVGTWNLAGVKAYENLDMTTWLMNSNVSQSPDVLVVGF